jgi:low affinity Fe/Cu permease
MKTSTKKSKHDLLAEKKRGRKPKMTKWFDKVSKVVTKATGRPATFIVATCVVIIWAVSGPVFNYSDTWQLVINTGTTIVTFLMVFVIQQSQNKDTVAIQLKLNELIASQKSASNRLIDIEDLTEDELEVLKKFYVKLSKLAKEQDQLYTTHSIDEATKAHEKKSSRTTNATH